MDSLIRSEWSLSGIIGLIFISRDLASGVNNINKNVTSLYLNFWKKYEQPTQSFYVQLEKVTSCTLPSTIQFGYANGFPNHLFVYTFFILLYPTSPVILSKCIWID